MNVTLSWLYEWNLIVWTNWIIFHDTHFASWNISTLFFRNKKFKVVKEKFHRISPPLRPAYTIKFFFHNPEIFHFERKVSKYFRKWNVCREILLFVHTIKFHSNDHDNVSFIERINNFIFPFIDITVLNHVWKYWKSAHNYVVSN